MGVYPTDGGDRWGGLTGGGYLRLMMLEHIHTVHCDQAYCGPVYGVRDMSGDKGVQAVVVTGRPVIGGDLDGG